jgi:hypothetical protein
MKINGENNEKFFNFIVNIKFLLSKEPVKEIVVKKESKIVEVEKNYFK